MFMGRQSVIFKCSKDVKVLVGEVVGIEFVNMPSYDSK
jgi:hypothetical protein